MYVFVHDYLRWVKSRRPQTSQLRVRHTPREPRGAAPRPRNLSPSQEAPPTTTVGVGHAQAQLPVPHTPASRQESAPRPSPAVQSSAMQVSLVLGAGASLANAMHFHGHRMPDTRPPLDATFFATAQSLGIALSPQLRTYFASVGIDPAPAAMRTLRMEEVFKDVFFDFQDDPQNQIAFNAYIDLVDLYLRVLRETTNWLAADSRRGAPIGRLIAAAAKAADEVTVMTFNHDLVIENEIQRRAQLRTRWCLEHGYGTFSAKLSGTTPGGTLPIFVRHQDLLSTTRDQSRF